MYIVHVCTVSYRELQRVHVNCTYGVKGTKIANMCMIIHFLKGTTKDTCTVYSVLKGTTKYTCTYIVHGFKKLNVQCRLYNVHVCITVS